MFSHTSFKSTLINTIFDHFIHIITCALIVILMLAQELNAAEVKVASASNFTATLKLLSKDFQKTTGHKAIISFGSTGKLYAQILYNAPFEVFLSADQKHPQLLEKNQAASLRFTYATGKLVLWSSDTNREVNESALKQGDFRKLALANPKTAPYGKAAIAVIQHLGLTESLKSKQVFGENIAQTYQFVATGNAQLGFISQAQISLNNLGRYWQIPQSLYDPIRQDAVLLKRGLDNPVAKAFIDYLKSNTAKEIIQQFGYAVEPK